MMKNQDTCCFYLVSCPCRARDRAAITFIHNDDDLHFLASERMDLTNAKQNKYIFIFKKRGKKGRATTGSGFYVAGIERGNKHRKHNEIILGDDIEYGIHSAPDIVR